ncbi:hypothetical protein F2Q69_00059520 [Brassica cretica]|uniref:Uncharacterized protein n=1 Tax=Brassica cretica TaxID=69181 RepID=A0A8S9RAK4_BRACR|nr:hypothetical protein F2Q69_00059520 [Brassica cretica]
MNSTGGGREILLAVEKSSLGVVSSKLNASFLLDRCVTSGNRSSLLPCRTCESYQGASSGIRATQPVLSIHLLIYPSILHLFNNMSFKRQNDTIIVQEFISEFKQMIEAKFAPINKRIDQLETQQKGSVPSHEKPESRRLAAENWSLKEISSELTIRGRYEEEAIDRCTSSAVDRYRREASTIEDYDRSMYILYHRSMSRRETRNLVLDDFKPKASPNYKITPDEFLT